MSNRGALLGCYTAPDGRGDGVRELAIGGALALVPGDAPGVRSPSFLAVHPALGLVYAVAELDDGRLVTLRRGASGAFDVVDERSTGGDHPCHVALSPRLDWAAVANFGDGSLAMVRLGADGIPTADAQLLRHAGSGPVPDRQDGPHCHQVTFDGDMVTVTDLGADRVRRYVLGGDGWVPAPQGDAVLRSGSGPRHQVADGDRRFVTGELDATITAYRVDDGGVWHEVASAPSTMLGGTCYPSHVELHAGHLYVGNRGPDTIAVFRLDGDQPVPVGEVATGGEWPRHFAIVGARVLVANERSSTVTALPIPAGAVVPSAAAETLATGSPTCIVGVPSY
jgi:6-phosphogluconolactonase (cycloisomerase 2 family)